MGSTSLFPPSDLNEFLLWATESISNELVILAGNSGQTQATPASFPRAPEFAVFAEFLVMRRILPEDLLSPIQTIATARNIMLHGELAQEQLFSINDLATKVLLKLKKIERYWYRVRLSHVPLFLDRGLTTPLEADGLMIMTLDSDGKEQASPRVYPRDKEYKAGRFVTWGWNMDRVFHQEGWYLDPETDQPKIAFSSSATFAGMEYPEQWGLEYRFPHPDVGLFKRRLP
jgi:hypothetical protein